MLLRLRSVATCSPSQLKKVIGARWKVQSQLHSYLVVVKYNSYLSCIYDTRNLGGRECIDIVNTDEQNATLVAQINNLLF